MGLLRRNLRGYIADLAGDRTPDEEPVAGLTANRPPLPTPMTLVSTGEGLALTAIVGFPVIGFILGRVSRWRRFGTFLVVGGPLTLALTVLYFMTFTPTIEGIQHGIAGLTERVLVLELDAWYVAIGWLAVQVGSKRRFQA